MRVYNKPVTNVGLSSDSTQAYAMWLYMYVANDLRICLSSIPHESCNNRNKITA